MADQRTIDERAAEYGFSRALGESTEDFARRVLYVLTKEPTGTARSVTRIARSTSRWVRHVDIVPEPANAVVHLFIRTYRRRPIPRLIRSRVERQVAAAVAEDIPAFTFARVHGD